MDLIKNRKILLVCRESSSYPFFFLAQRLKSLGNMVAVFFVNPLESHYNRCYFNSTTYYYFKDNLNNIKIYGLKEFCNKFDERLNANQLDIEYLLAAEIKYSNYKNLNLHLMSSQLTSAEFHDRFFYQGNTYFQRLLYLELGFKEIEYVLDDFNPDVIFDNEDSELLRSLLNEVAFQKSIPYINIDFPRFEHYKLPTYCLGLATDRKLVNAYRHYYHGDQDSILDELQYIQNFRMKNSLMNSEFIGTSTAQTSENSLWNILKYSLGTALYFWNVHVASKNWKLYRKNQILYTNPLKHYLFIVISMLKRWYLFKTKNFFNSISKNEKYVYMPLHVIPESTTSVKAPFYINELFVIEQVSKSLPVGVLLYVKEHPAMLGERSFLFYRRVKSMPNVRLVGVWQHDHVKELIEHSVGVITISGTTAFESALLGKRAVVFADVPFNLIDGIVQVNSFKDLPDALLALGNVDNKISCASYLAAVKSQSKSFNLKYLISEGERIIKKETHFTDEYSRELNQLLLFYTDAYKSYEIDGITRI